MKKVVLFFILILLFSNSAISHITNSEPEKNHQLREINELIDQTNFIVGRGCSGTLVSLHPPLILTNYHCIQPNVKVIERDRADENNVIIKNREIKLEPVIVRQNHYRGHETVGFISYSSDIIARQQNRDLAILRLKSETIPHQLFTYILPKTSEIYRGEKVFAVGNPAGLDATMTSGIISSVSRTFRFPWADNEDLPMIQTDVGLFGGNSGGSLYNEDLFLIGVPTAGFMNATHLGLAIPSSIVWEVFENHCLANYIGGTNPSRCDKPSE